MDVPRSGHLGVVSLNRCPPRPHSDCVSVTVYIARLRVSVGLDTEISTWEVGSWVQLPLPTPSALWQLFLFELCLYASLLPSSHLQAWATSDPHFFPQVPPGAAKTQEAPGTSELHGGHLQGTARGKGSARRQLGRLMRQALWPWYGGWGRAWYTQTLGKGLWLNNE